MIDKKNIFFKVFKFNFFLNLRINRLDYEYMNN